MTKPKKRADSGTTRKSATREKTLTTMSVQHDSDTVKRSIALLSKLERTEQVLHDLWMTSQNPEVAFTWLHCVHNLRQVARDLKHSDARVKELEEGAI
jgi:hypothetical protein